MKRFTQSAIADAILHIELSRNDCQAAFDTATNAPPACLASVYKAKGNWVQNNTAFRDRDATRSEGVIAGRAPARQIGAARSGGHPGYWVNPNEARAR
jgi:hypothetical protein